MEFLGINEAARQLGVHENTVRRWADQGLIRTVRLPSGTRRFTEADIKTARRTMFKDFPAELVETDQALASNR